MKKIVIFFTCLAVSFLFECNIAIAQQFQCAMGTSARDWGKCIIQTSDGGYAVTGGVNSAGVWISSDIYVIKINANGNLMWNKTLSGTGYDEGYSIVQTNDGGYVIAGISNSFGAGDFDGILIKYNATGTLQWFRKFGGNGSVDMIFSVVKTTDGGFAVAGYTESFSDNPDVYIIRFNSDGIVLWSKTIGGTGIDQGKSIVQTNDGGFAVGGYTNSFGLASLYVIKLDVSGNLQWTRTVGATGKEWGESIIQSSDGGYAISGGYNVNSIDVSDLYLVKLNSAGNLQWTCVIDALDGESGRSLVQANNGNFIVAGMYYPYTGTSDAYVATINSSGIFQTARKIGWSSYDFANSITKTSDGGFAMTGSTISLGAGSYDVYVVKLDSYLGNCGNVMFGGTSSSSGISGSGGSIMTVFGSWTSVTDAVQGSAGYYTNICSLPGIKKIDENFPVTFSLLQNYPNPFNPVTSFKFQVPNLSNIKIDIFDMLGREVETLVNEQLRPGTYEAEWDASDYASGIYFYQLVAQGTTDKFVMTKKMTLIK